VLSSRVANIEVAERALLDLCSEGGVDTEECYWLVSACREAVANAVLHGNRQDPDRQVAIGFWIAEGEITMRVEDEGEGFDLDAVPDPTDPELLLRPTGRGIFYMRRFMNRVEFSRAPGGGTAVEMTRRLQSETRSVRNEK
jgi:serine/threonine-protein kinase RsbW